MGICKERGKTPVGGKGSGKQLFTPMFLSPPQRQIRSDIILSSPYPDLNNRKKEIQTLFQQSTAGEFTVEQMNLSTVN